MARDPVPVLLTRPLEPARRFADALRAGGAGRIAIAPLMRIAPVADALPPLPGGLLLTSQAAVEAYRALGGPAGLPAWAVGPRTGAAARAAGLDLRGVAPDAAALAGMVPPDAGPLTHLRGEVQRGELVARLRARGIAADEAVLYGQRAQPLPAEGRALLAEGGPVLAPVFSPRSAALLARAVPEAAWPRLRVVAISAAAARPMARAAPRIAAAPDGAAMREAVLAWLRPADG
jgi:uroporphyrinogen-III synthase